MAGRHIAQQTGLEFRRPVQGHILHRPGVDGEQRHHLLRQRQRGVLRLFQNFGGELPPGQLRPGRGVQIGGAELGERRQFAVLRQIQPQPPGHFADGAGLGGAADAGHRQAGVHRRADAGVEQLRLQVNLPVGDGDYIGGDVGRHIAGLGFDDGQGGDGAAAVGFVQPRRAFQQAAVQIEDVAGVGFPAGRPAQQQRHLPVGPGVLGQVIVDDEHIPPLVHKLFGHGAAGVGGQVLQRGRVGGAGGDDDGMLHRPGLVQRAHHLGHLALLLADGDIDANQVAAFLVDDGVHGDGRLAGGAVADDEFPLAPANGNHRVDGLDAGLHRGVDRLADDDVGGDGFRRAGAAGGDGALAVQRAAQGVDHPADEGVADGDFDDAAGGTDAVALFDGVGVAQHGGAHQVGLQVEGQPQHFAAEVQQLVGTDALQALDAGDAVAHLHHGAHIHQGQIAAEFLDLALNQRNYVLSPGSHRSLSLKPKRISPPAVSLR